MWRKGERVIGPPEILRNFYFGFALGLRDISSTLLPGKLKFKNHTGYLSGSVLVCVKGMVVRKQGTC